MTVTRAPTPSRLEAVPSSRSVTKWPPAVLVVEVGQRLVLRERSTQVEPAVVVEVADGQPAAERGATCQGARPAAETSTSRPVGRRRPGAGAGIAYGNDRAVVVDVAVGGRQVEPAVVVDVEEGDAEAQQVPARRGQADGGGLVGEDAAAEVVVEGRRLAVEVGHGQVGPAVAVEVAAGDPHAAW